MKRLQIALIGIIGAVMVFLCVVLGIFLTREKPSGAATGTILWCRKRSSGQKTYSA